MFLKYALVSALIAAGANGADAEFFLSRNKPLTRTLALALAQYAEVSPGSFSKDGESLRILNEQKEVGISCTPAKAECQFNVTLNTHHLIAPQVDQVVFDALLRLSQQESESGELLNLRVTKNRNRTFVHVEQSLTFPWDVSEYIKCNATPKRGGGFQHAHCDYHVPSVITGEPASKLLEAARANSDVSAKLAIFAEGWTATPSATRIVEYIDWRRYGWKELHARYAKSPQPTVGGEVSSVYLNIFVNSTRADGKLVIEKSQEYYDHISIIRPRP